MTSNLRVSFSMALSSLLEPLPLLGTFVVAILSIAIYRVYFHPLSHIPGPLKAKLSPLWLYLVSYHGVEASSIDELHKEYGPVVRIAPNEVDISDGAAINTIYVKNGGFMKNKCYTNFDIDLFHTLFSALDPAHRAVRSKAVVNMFSQSNIREGQGIIRGCVQRMVDRMKKESENSMGAPVNLLNITRSLALDAVTGYLFHKPYNGIMEAKLSASQFVDMFVAVGRFFYLPKWAFEWAELWQSRLAEFKPEVYHSIATVDKFVAGLVDEARAEDKGNGQTYQARLLNAGISREETIAQCKDLMFAGTDSTGMNLATICWYLTKRPDAYAKLRKEIVDNHDVDPQTLPYLSGVIKEGLRLSMANPTRLPRIVSQSGLRVPGLPYIPPGASVGVSAYSVHFNDKVFENSREFRPERWLKPTEEMLRDFFAWGAGPRQCIARNLATAELFWAVQELAKEDVLRGATPFKDDINILEWFNSKVIDERIDLVWSDIPSL
jgi:cytochrome P450